MLSTQHAIERNDASAGFEAPHSPKVALWSRDRRHTSVSWLGERALWHAACEERTAAERGSADRSEWLTSKVPTEKTLS